MPAPLTRAQLVRPVCVFVDGVVELQYYAVDIMEYLVCFTVWLSHLT